MSMMLILFLKLLKCITHCSLSPFIKVHRLSRELLDFGVNFSGYFCYLTVGIGFGILSWLLSRLLNADSQNCSCGSVGPHTTADSDEESDGSENNSDDDIEEAASEENRMGNQVYHIAGPGGTTISPPLSFENVRRSASNVLGGRMQEHHTGAHISGEITPYCLRCVDSDDTKASPSESGGLKLRLRLSATARRNSNHSESDDKISFGDGMHPSSANSDHHQLIDYEVEPLRQLERFGSMKDSGFSECADPGSRKSFHVALAESESSSIADSSSDELQLLGRGQIKQEAYDNAAFMHSSDTLTSTLNVEQAGELVDQPSNSFQDTIESGNETTLPTDLLAETLLAVGEGRIAENKCDGAVDRVEPSQLVDGAVGCVEPGQLVDGAVDRVEPSQLVDGAVDHVEPSQLVDGAVDRSEPSQLADEDTVVNQSKHVTIDVNQSLPEDSNINQSTAEEKRGFYRHARHSVDFRLSADSSRYSSFTSLGSLSPSSSFQLIQNNFDTLHFQEQYIKACVNIEGDLDGVNQELEEFKAALSRLGKADTGEHFTDSKTIQKLSDMVSSSDVPSVDRAWTHKAFDIIRANRSMNSNRAEAAPVRTSSLPPTPLCSKSIKCDSLQSMSFDGSSCQSLPTLLNDQDELESKTLLGVLSDSTHGVH
ncbi:hypothetical protein EB796_018533 [Bugula neritina]|uniref:Uncharacterized protein n=1 Tax=Bugula neritina TaxID=10212 RepID=A0A7J7JAA7_BUGNE|nr:hypothetical protein EB796_018533 [Bugula neritina]